MSNNWNHWIVINSTSTTVTRRISTETGQMPLLLVSIRGVCLGNVTVFRWPLCKTRYIFVYHPVPVRRNGLLSSMSWKHHKMLREGSVSTTAKFKHATCCLQFALHLPLITDRRITKIKPLIRTYGVCEAGSLPVRSNANADMIFLSHTWFSPNGLVNQRTRNCRFS